MWASQRPPVRARVKENARTRRVSLVGKWSCGDLHEWMQKEQRQSSTWLCERHQGRGNDRLVMASRHLTVRMAGFLLLHNMDIKIGLKDRVEDSRCHEERRST